MERWRALARTLRVELKIWGATYKARSVSDVELWTTKSRAKQVVRMRATKPVGFSRMSRRQVMMRGMLATAVMKAK